MDIITNRASVEGASPVFKDSSAHMPAAPSGSSDSGLIQNSKEAVLNAQMTSNKEYLEEITQEIQKKLNIRNVNINFSTYGDNNENISIVVKEKDTGRIIREIPSEEAQNLSVRMEELIGLIFNDLA